MRFCRSDYRIALCVLCCGNQSMNRLIVVSLALAVMWSGTAYGSAFFKDFVGVWRVKGQGISSTLRVKKEKNGVISLWMIGRYVNRGWLKPNGTYKGETYLKGRRVESYLGTWRLSGANMLKITVRGRAGAPETITRRVNRDRFIYGEPANGAKSQITLTRVRN